MQRDGSALYGTQSVSWDMADGPYQHQQYPSSFASSSTHPFWSLNWESPQDIPTYDVYAMPIHVYNGQASVLPPHSSDVRYIPRSTSSSLAAAMTPYPESAQRTVLPDPTHAPSTTSYNSSPSSRTSPGLSSHPSSPVLATADQHSEAFASSSRHAASSSTQGPSSGPIDISAVGQTEKNSAAAATNAGQWAKGVFHMNTFSSITSEADSAPVSVPVALKPEEASGLSPCVLAFSSTLEPLEDAEDPFPLCIEDLATRDEEELYHGLSHTFYVNTAGTQSSRQSGPSGDVSTSLHPAPWNAVKAESTPPSVSPMLSPTSSRSVNSVFSDVSSDMGAAYTTAPIASPPPQVISGAKAKRKFKMHHCEECGKPFPRPSGLATHMNSHSGEKPFKCLLIGCPKMFTVRSNAKRHLRTHGIQLTSSRSPSLLQKADAGTIGFETPVVADVQYVPNMGPNGKLWKIKWMGPGASKDVPKATEAGYMTVEFVNLFASALVPAVEIS